ncbi:putative NAD(P)/FAD-binding protein YdhS [Rhizobium sp. SG_E_25_P2]|uniref:FAD/NAD(P)-binding protein n=1 Tax=Rhizobium sp. SG_E_25_P2 TaxID=2879942 RepID=UPI002474E382|nr:FAD/NAD(P)-binding protein [Rhizobium sp. SG_E_25_P2]MDH6264830.1 putative NAD(P)/FAD-binding protein YdhS [Rhizobium sp. SG_E_25_P2]
MTLLKNSRPVVAIIGGGFTGSAVAWNLTRAIPNHEVQIVVHEPRKNLGAGLAYDTSDPTHRINVPAERMSLDADDGGDFMAWLAERSVEQTDPEAQLPDGRIFPRRADFGAYVAARLKPMILDGRIQHARCEVVAIERDASCWRIRRSDGTTLLADSVVIATSHPSPAAPRTLAALLEGHPRFVADPTAANALATIRPGNDVLIVGNGLTGADIAASLLARGHTGHITAISRRGLRSRGHAFGTQEPHGDFISRPIKSARLLTRRIRETIKQAALFDVSWHAVLDAVRAQGQAIWRNLPIAERRRIVRHLRPFWDVHRFRIAPQVENAIDAAIGAGQMESLAASVSAVSYFGDKIRVAMRLSRRKGTVLRDIDAVVVATGPAHGSVLSSQPYLDGLAGAGHIRLDPVGLGLDCDQRSRLIGANGEVQPGLFVAGPLARGAFGELMGLPQVTLHARDVAFEVKSDVAPHAIARTETAA